MTQDTPSPERRAEILKKERVYAGHFAVDRVEVAHSAFDGGRRTTTVESFERGDSAAALVLDRAAGTVKLVEQFRYPALAAGASGWLVELPAGAVADAETPEATALREAGEETGAAACPIEPIASVFASPGGTSERIHIFCVEAVGPAAPGVGPEPSEDLRRIDMSVDAFVADALAGRIDDAKTLVAGLWLAAHRARLGV